MTMRLLQKSDVVRAKAIDRQREIEEGKKLADRVDTLRRLSSDEESNIQAFRARSLANVQSEIAVFFEQKNSLIEDIEIRKRELSTLMIPLDGKWKDVDRAQRVCEDWERVLDERTEKLDRDRKETLALSMMIEKKRAHLSDEEERVKEIVTSAQAMISQAEIVVSEANVHAHTTYTANSKKEGELTAREIAVHNRELDVEAGREHNAAVHHQNDLDRVRLEDERVTLQKGFDELQRKIESQ